MSALAWIAIAIILACALCTFALARQADTGHQGEDEASAPEGARPR
jgi:hypothetical protein